MKTDKPNIFLCAGLTGGPIIPAVAIAKNLNCNPIILGTTKGFEKNIAKSNNYQFLSLPIAKLNFLSFKNYSLWSILYSIIDSILNIVKLFWALCLSFIYLLKFRPKLIISVGGFCAVPVIFTMKLTNILRITKSKLVIHQQDPDIGLTNRLTANWADLLTCNFIYTQKKFTSFKNATIIPGPIDYERFNEKKFASKKLASFVSESNLPIFLIFGGGSGSTIINSWVEENTKSLCEKYRVIHLFGSLQKTIPGTIESQNYLKLNKLNKDIGLVFKKADVILCRAGMSTISELIYLNKQAFLVPLANSHQEKNAQNIQLISQNFTILEEKNKDSWFKDISNSKNTKPQKNSHGSNQEIKNQLDQYYQKVSELIST